MKKLLATLLAVMMIATMCVVFVHADGITISYNVQVKEDGTQAWYFAGPIPDPKYEAGWKLFDEEGNIFDVNGWEWDDSNGYTILNTKLNGGDPATVYELAAAGNLYAGIIDVTEQGNGVVDASNCPTVDIIGDDGGVEEIAGGLGHCAAEEKREVAVTRCNVVTLEKVVLDAEGQTWFFSGILQNGYEAGWQLVDDEGAYYTVSGWTWDHSKGYTKLHTVCTDQDAAIAKAAAGKLTAGIVDVSGKLDNLVAANDSWTLIKGGLSTEVLAATQMWGEHLVASARAITADTPAPTTGDALLAVIAVVVAASAGVVLVKKH